MRALITGADGLLGSNLTRELLDQGFTVRALVHPASAAPTLAGLPLELVRGDITDPAQILAATDGMDYVFHCAAITDLHADPALVWAVNLEGTRNVLAACLEKRVRRLLFIGSASSYQYGTAAAPGTEANPFPAAYRGVAYIESKAAAADLVRQYVASRDLDAVILAPTFMLGAHDSRPSSGALIQQFITRTLRYVSPGSRNFAYVGDVAKGVAAAVTKGRRGEVYLLGGQNLSYRDFFTRVARIAGVAPPRATVPAALVRAAGLLGSGYETVTGKAPLLNNTLARFACSQTCYSPARAVAALDLPQTPVETGIIASIESLKRYGYLP
jgi:dihydroflavonol-4-reductase